MIIIDPSIEILARPSRNEALALIELAGRTCYRSQEKMSDGSAAPFIRSLIKKGHLSVLEHVSATVRIMCSRAVSHELVRHRLASYSQQSQRYVNMRDGVTFVRPEWANVSCGDYEAEPENQLIDWYDEMTSLWFESVRLSEIKYKKLLRAGARPEQAREVLPNSTATEIVMTANVRQWLHIFSLRCAPAAHPEMRRVMKMIQRDFRKWLPEVFNFQMNSNDCLEPEKTLLELT